MTNYAPLTTYRHETSYGSVAFILYGECDFQKPVFYFHGFAGSRLEPTFAHEAAKAEGLTLIALDRPGVGESTIQKSRTLLDWPPLVREVARLLNLNRFSVCGVSGGGPYAFACAHELKENVTGVAVISGIGELKNENDWKALAPSARRLLKLSSSWPTALYPLIFSLGHSWRMRPELALRSLSHVVSEKDRTILADTTIHSLWRKNVGQGFRQAPHGILSEMRVLAEPWGFEIGKIRCPATLLHGLSDTFVAPYFAQKAKGLITHAQLKFFEGEGHFLAISEISIVLKALSAFSHEDSPYESPHML